MSFFLVCKKQCNECLFSDKSIVSSRRKAQLLEECQTNDRHFICHKGSLAGGKYENLCCKGFYDQKPGVGQLLRIAQRLGVVRFVEPPSDAPESTSPSPPASARKAHRR
jgi:hypothetical protein